MGNFDWLFKDRQHVDSFIGVLLEIRDVNWTSVSAQAVFENLPYQTQCIAFEWGLSDTAFRDEAAQFLRDTPTALNVQVDPIVCGLCNRPLGEVQVEDHHLIPKELGGRDTVPVHRICHQKIHSTFTNRDLLHYYHTFDRLLEHEEIRKFVSWVQRKDPSFYDRNDQTQYRRSKNNK